MLRNPGPALTGNLEVFARLVAQELVREGGDESVFLLRDLDDATARDVLRASSAAVSAALRDAIDKTAAETAAASPSPATVGRTAGTPSPDPEDEFDPDPIVMALAEYAKYRAVESPSLAHQVILTLLRVDRRQCRDAVEELLGEVEPAADADVVEAVLAGTRIRALASWPEWFAGVAPGAVVTRHAETVGKLAARLWVNAGKEDATLVVVRAAVAAFSGVVDQLPDEMQPNLTADAVEAVAEAVTNEAEADARSRLLRNAQPFGAAGLVDMTRVYRAALPTLRETLAIAMSGEIPADGALGRYLSRDTVDIVRVGTPNNADGPGQVKAALAQLTDCAWLPEPLRTELLLRLTGTSGVPVADLGTLPSADDITGLVDEHGQAAATAVAEWVPLACPDGGTIASVFAALQENQVLTEPIVSAVVAVRRGWSREQRVDFLRAQIGDPDSNVPDAAEARFIGLRDIDASDVANVITERFGSCTNNPQRKAVVGVLAAAAIRDGASRKRLIESVVIPMLKPPGGHPQTGMTEIGLDALASIGAPLPHGVKKALGEAVKGAVSGNSTLEKKAVKVLGPLGYQIESSGWLLGRKKAVKYSK